MASCQYILAIKIFYFTLSLIFVITPSMTLELFLFVIEFKHCTGINLTGTISSCVIPKLSLHALGKFEVLVLYPPVLAL